MTQCIKKDLLTPTETSFFLKLRKALPNHYIFPQVSFNALLDVSNKKEWAERNRFNRKVADFVIYNSVTMKVAAIIELDDYTHNYHDQDDSRDELLKGAGYHIIRFNVKDGVSLEEIKQAIPD